MDSNVRKECPMSNADQNPTRRNAVSAAAALGSALSIPAIALAGAHAGTSDPAVTALLADHAGEWDWLVGSWAVSHSRLKERLAGNTEWESFKGTCVNWPLLGGQGNVDDNVLELPAGRYRGVGVRAFDPKTKNGQSGGSIRATPKRSIRLTAARSGKKRAHGFRARQLTRWVR
jgi:hypothetical protein